MDWNALNEQQRQALFIASTVQPPHPPGTTEASRREEQLHAVLFSIQLEHDMARLSSQRQHLQQIIDPAMLTAYVQGVHYGGVTINGPHLDEAGRRCFYLERQCGHACAQHAVNAMVGGPLVSLEHFAQWEAHALAQQGIQPDIETITATMMALGVHPESVQGALHNLQIPTHMYASRPINNAQGVLALDPRQARLLDRLPTDRMLLQADRYEGDSTDSHYVAFRRDGDKWVLLDSMENAPQYEVAPSEYLLRDERYRSFTAIWPQNALRKKSADFDIEGMVSGLLGTGDETATHVEGGIQDSQNLASPAQANANATQASHALEKVKSDPIARTENESYYRNRKLGTIKTGETKQYTLNGKPLYRPYLQLSEPEKMGNEIKEIGRGALHTTYSRKNPNSTVYVKKFHPEERENPDAEVWPINLIKDQAKLCDDLAELLTAKDPETISMRDHFAIEILKEIKGDVPIYLTPIVNGFTLEQYLDGPDKDKYSAELPRASAKQKLGELKNAVKFLFKKGFVHFDIHPGNIMFDRDLNKLVLIDFELLEKTRKSEDVEHDLKRLKKIEMMIKKNELLPVSPPPEGW